MARRKVWDEPREKRSGSHAVVPNGYQLVKVPQEKPERKGRNTDPVSRLAGGLARWAVRHRWHLGPFVGYGSLVWAAATSPAAAAITCGGVALLAHLSATRMAEQFRGRAWLSMRERSTLTLWFGLAFAWAAALDAGALRVDLTGLLILAGMLLWPTWTWSMSRRVRRKAKPSKLAQKISAVWPMQMATMGPTPLKGSLIVPGSVADLPGGSLTMLIRLADSVHSTDALTPDVRRFIERRMEFGVGTVDTGAVHDHSGQFQVTLTPARHLENADAEWAGPVLNDNGTVDLAVTPSGESVLVPLHDKSRVKHFAIVGVTGTGKSNDLSNLILPGVMAEREIVWYCDGKRGTSAAFLAGACDWWAVDETAWAQVVDTIDAVLKARQSRRGERRLSSWRGAKEKDPIITVVFDEASIIGAALKQRHHDLVLEDERASTAFGIRFGQITQDAQGIDWIGGRVSRDQIGGGGIMIGHRPGSGTGAFLTAGTTSEGIDLRSLPAQPGWAGVIVQGEVVAAKARVRYAAEPAVLERLDGFTPRGLTGPDLMAAMSVGPAYRDRIQGRDAAEAMARAAELDDEISEPDTAPLRVPEPMILRHADPAPEDVMAPLLNLSAQAMKDRAESTRLEVLAVLLASDDEVSAADLVRVTGISRASVDRALKALQEGEQVSRNEETRGWMALTTGSLEAVGT